MERQIKQCIQCVEVGRPLMFEMYDVRHSCVSVLASKKRGCGKEKAEEENRMDAENVNVY